MTTPPGWYPDPTGSGRQMYWDGQGWAAPQAPVPTKKAGGGKVALIVVAIAVILFGIGKCGSSDSNTSSSSTSSSKMSSLPSSAQSSAAAAEPATPTAAPAGSAVRDGKF